MLGLLLEGYKFFVDCAPELDATNDIIQTSGRRVPVVQEGPELKMSELISNLCTKITDDSALAKKLRAAAAAATSNKRPAAGGDGNNNPSKKAKTSGQEIVLAAEVINTELVSQWFSPMPSDGSSNIDAGAGEVSSWMHSVASALNDVLAQNNLSSTSEAAQVRMCPAEFAEAETATEESTSGFILKARSMKSLNCLKPEDILRHRTMTTFISISLELAWAKSVTISGKEHTIWSTTREAARLITHNAIQKYMLTGADDTAIVAEESGEGGLAFERPLKEGPSLTGGPLKGL